MVEYLGATRDGRGMTGRHHFPGLTWRQALSKVFSIRLPVRASHQAELHTRLMRSRTYPVSQVIFLRTSLILEMAWELGCSLPPRLLTAHLAFPVLWPGTVLIKSLWVLKDRGPSCPCESAGVECLEKVIYKPCGHGGH